MNLFSSAWVDDLVKGSIQSGKERKMQRDFEIARRSAYKEIQRGVRRVVEKLRSAGEDFDVIFDPVQVRLIVKHGGGRRHNASIYFSVTRPPTIESEYSIDFGNERSGRRQFVVVVDDPEKELWHLEKKDLEGNRERVTADISSVFLYRWVSRVLEIEADEAQGGK